MSLLKWFRPEINGTGYKIVAGSFIPDGTNNPTTKYGTGFSVVWTSTGVWTVTITDTAFANYVSIVVTGQYATAENDAHQFLVGGISTSARTFAIKHVGSADVANTDLAAANIATSGTANKINFIVVIAESDVIGAGV